MKMRLITTLAIVLMLFATLSLPAIAADDEKTVPASVIVSEPEHISITITGAAASGIDFGSKAPGTNDILETHSSNVTPSIIVTVVTTPSNVDLQINGTNFDATTFPITNAKYSIEYNSAKTPLSTSYNNFATDVVKGTSISLWHWLDIPVGAAVDSYSSTFSYKAVPHVTP